MLAPTRLTNAAAQLPLRGQVRRKETHPPPPSAPLPPLRCMLGCLLLGHYLLRLCLAYEFAQREQHVAQDTQERDNHHDGAKSDIIDRCSGPVLPGWLRCHGKWRDGQPDACEKEQEQDETSGRNKPPHSISYTHYASLLIHSLVNRLVALLVAAGLAPCRQICSESCRQRCQRLVEISLIGNQGLRR